MSIDMENRTAFITGGGGGIGGGIAAAFVEQGMRVVIADIDLEFARQNAANFGKQALAVELDVTSETSWTMAKQLAEDKFGEVDVLCGNAGISSGFLPLVDMPTAQFDDLMAVNIRGIYLGVRAFAPGMIERGRGHIVNTSSVNGLVPHGTFAAYSASKFAVLGLSDALREELQPLGVGVSVLFPGLTRSRMSMRIKEDQKLDDDQFRAIEAKMMDPLWMGRAVVEAMKQDNPYIITHPDHLAALEARHERIVSAFGEPAQPGYRASAGAVGDRT